MAFIHHHLFHGTDKRWWFSAACPPVHDPSFWAYIVDLGTVTAESIMPSLTSALKQHGRGVGGWERGANKIMLCALARTFFSHAYAAVQRMPSWQDGRAYRGTKKTKHAKGYVDCPKSHYCHAVIPSAFFPSMTIHNLKSNEFNNAPNVLWTLWTTRQVSSRRTTTSEQLFTI